MCSSDLGHGRFTVVTGVGGEPWLAAARAAGERFGVPITEVAIGPGLPFDDPYGTWADLRETGDAGVLLVRPDLYVAARHLAAPESAEAAQEWLTSALARVLGR